MQQASVHKGPQAGLLKCRCEKNIWSDVDFSGKNVALNSRGSRYMQVTDMLVAVVVLVLRESVTLQSKVNSKNSLTFALLAISVVLHHWDD